MADKKRSFKVKSFYDFLCAEETIVFPVYEVWRTGVAIRTCFLVCEAKWGKILTIDLLVRRG